MGCREVRDRLVAWQDAELSPGEAAQVADHVRSCAACRRHERTLADARPERPPAPPLPAQVRAALDARLDPDVLLAASRARPLVPAPSERLRAWLRREARVPMGLVVAYVVILCAAVGFGLSGLLAPAPAPTLTDVERPSSPAAGPGMPSDQFRPAAYDPGAAAPHDPE